MLGGREIAASSRCGMVGRTAPDSVTKSGPNRLEPNRPARTATDMPCMPFAR
jgi:hypothetical protein